MYASDKENFIAYPIEHDQVHYQTAIDNTLPEARQNVKERERESTQSKWNLKYLTLNSLLTNALLQIDNIFTIIHLRVFIFQLCKALQGVKKSKQKYLLNIVEVEIE